MPIFYNIAHGEKMLETAENYPWPYDIDICFENIEYPIAFSEGVAHGSGWCNVSAVEALEDKWRKFFAITDSAWLIPHIEKRVAGIQFPKDEILVKYQCLYGRAPKTYIVDV